MSIGFALQMTKKTILNERKDKKNAKKLVEDKDKGEKTSIEVDSIISWLKKLRKETCNINRLKKSKCH